MAEEGVESRPPRRHGKPKEGRKRKDAGAKIVVRVSADERARLVAAAGDRPVSDHVRQRLFGTGDGRGEAGDRTRDVFRKVAALHGLARKIDRMMDAGIAEDGAGELIDEIRAAIERFVGTVPDAEGDPTP